MTRKIFMILYFFYEWTSSRCGFAYRSGPTRRCSFYRTCTGATRRRVVDLWFRIFLRNVYRTSPCLMLRVSRSIVGSSARPSTGRGDGRRGLPRASGDSRGSSRRRETHSACRARKTGFRGETIFRKRIRQPDKSV